MPLPVLPPNAIVRTPLADQITPFPPNLIGEIPRDVLLSMTQWMMTNYIWPQLMERRPFEPIWDELLDMYRISLSKDKLRLNKENNQRLKDEVSEILASVGEDPSKAQVSDSLIFDAVDRLKNLNHFISWKDGTPIQYNVPKYFDPAKEDQFYHPLDDKIKSANGILEWNIGNQDVYRKHLIAAGHHYLYGVSFILSEFEFETKTMNRRNKEVTEIVKCGVTFEPISIRRIWLNFRISAYNMEYQPCPFFVQETPRFAILQNAYHPTDNPFGFGNLEGIADGNFLFSSSEMESARKGLESKMTPEGITAYSTLLKSEHSVEGLWTFYPMMPFDPVTREFIKRKDGSMIPYKRFIWQSFANQLTSGQQTPLRIQENFYPRDQLPLYGSSHMPDLDTGLYTPTIGELLANHYKELCTATNQFLDNKNWINNPPSWYSIGSPCANQDRNKPGADIPVTGASDFGWRTPYDATQTTVGFMQYTRDMAQTTGKVTDAILGKAMGGRTSATEASNIFQAAMSGVSTDINLFNYDIMGGYAWRVWEYCGAWMDQDLIKAITGQYGAPLTAEDMQTRVGIKWDVGSSYIESIVKQGHYRYALEAGVRSPCLRQDILWKAFFQELRMHEAIPAVMDGGFEKEVQRATEQTIETYMGRPIIIDPNQDHNIAIEVKIRFLEDKDSKWNIEFGPQPSMTMPGISRAQELAKQIQLHQQFAMLQMQQQLAQQQMQIGMEAAKREGNAGSQGRLPSPQEPEQRSGQVAQNNG